MTSYNSNYNIQLPILYCIFKTARWSRRKSKYMELQPYPPKPFQKYCSVRLFDCLSYKYRGNILRLKEGYFVYNDLESQYVKI